MNDPTARPGPRCGPRRRPEDHPMSMPFYVSPEQLMKDRADFARKGIARGRSVVAVQYADGVLFASENPSQALHKVSEIYDRIAFAAVGRYNEFENLRIAGVRLADMRGYAYDRRDVTGRGLANAYAQTLGTIFSSGGEKPYEVEIFVAEIGDQAGRRPDLPADLPGLRSPTSTSTPSWAAPTRWSRPTSKSTTPRTRRCSDAPPRRGRRTRAQLRGGQRWGSRPGHPGERPRGRRARPHPHPAHGSSCGSCRLGSRLCSATAGRPLRNGAGVASTPPTRPADETGSTPPA